MDRNEGSPPSCWYNPIDPPPDPFDYESEDEFYESLTDEDKALVDKITAEQGLDARTDKLRDLWFEYNKDDGQDAERSVW